MSGTQAPSAAGTPKHLWVVGIVGVLWSAVGALDYTMTEMHNEAWLEGFTEAEVGFFYSFPSWVVACWAIAVWGGVVGCLLLLLRKRLAVQVLLLSLLGMVTSNIYIYGFSDGMKYMGGAGALTFTALIFAVSVFLYLYAKAMCRKGVLR